MFLASFILKRSRPASHMTLAVVVQWRQWPAAVGGFASESFLFASRKVELKLFHPEIVIKMKSKTADSANIYPKMMELIKEPINVYLLAIVITGVIQFVYMGLVGTFPFNAFLAGFLSCIASFALGVSLKKTDGFKGFLFAHLVLHLSVVTFMG